MEKLLFTGKLFFLFAFFPSFFPLYQRPHAEGNDSHADSGLDTEEKTFHFAGKLSAENILNERSSNRFKVRIHFFYNGASGIVRTAEFCVFQCKQRDKSDQDNSDQ